MKSYTSPSQQRSQSLPWWAILFAGVILAVIGGLLIVTPRTGATVLFWILGTTCVIGGIALIASIWFNRASWVWRLLAGIGAILLGLALISQPLFGAYLFAAMILWILGAAVVVGGIVLVLWGISYAGWVRGLLGALCMLIGSMLILGSTAGPLKAPWAFGIAAVAGGAMAIVAAFRMRH